MRAKDRAVYVMGWVDGQEHRLAEVRNLLTDQQWAAVTTHIRAEAVAAFNRFELEVEPEDG